MTPLVETLSSVSKDLVDLDVQSALVGGLAVTIRSYDRNTRDVDFAISVDSSKQLDRHIRNLLHRGYRYHEMLTDRDSGEPIGERLIPPGNEDVIVDLLHDISGIEQEIVSMAEQIEILPNLVIPVARLGHLIAMKTLSWRFIDRADLEQLLASAQEDDLSLAHDSLTRIQQGTRGRTLESSDLLTQRLEQMLAASQP